MDMLKRKFDPGGNHLLSMGELNPAIPKNKLRQYVNYCGRCLLRMKQLIETEASVTKHVVNRSANLKIVYVKER